MLFDVAVFLRICRVRLTLRAVVIRCSMLCIEIVSVAPTICVWKSNGCAGFPTLWYDRCSNSHGSLTICLHDDTCLRTLYTCSTIVWLYYNLHVDFTIMYGCLTIVFWFGLRLCRVVQHVSNYCLILVVLCTIVYGVMPVYGWYACVCTLWLRILAACIWLRIRCLMSAYNSLRLYVIGPRLVLHCYVCVESSYSLEYKEMVVYGSLSDFVWLYYVYV